MKIRDLFITNILAVLLGLLASFSILFLLKINPAEVFLYTMQSLFSDRYNIAEIFVKATPLIFSALAFAITFKANLFNIGAQGQFYMGSIVAVSVSLLLSDHFPSALSLIIIMLLSAIGACSVGALIGYLKAKFRANEFLISMMSTYVILAFMNYLLRTFLKEAKKEYPRTDAINKALHLPIILKGTRLHVGFLIAIAVAVCIWILLYKTGIGFKIRAVGNNENCARACGIDSKVIIIIAFCISAAMAGIAGFMEINGLQHMLIQDFNVGLGAAGIGIAILANANPIGIIFSSLLFGMLSVMGNLMGRIPGRNIPASMVEIMQGLVMLFVIMAYFLRVYLENRREKIKRRKGVGV